MPRISSKNSNKTQSQSLKQVIIIRKDLKLPKGKLAVQVAHASLQATLKALTKNKRTVKKWLSQGARKVVVKAENLEELQALHEKALKQGLTAALIKDAGLTVVKPGTITALAIGPDIEEKIDEITKHLKLV